MTFLNCYCSHFITVLQHVIISTLNDGVKRLPVGVLPQVRGKAPNFFKKVKK